MVASPFILLWILHSRTGIPSLVFHNKVRSCVSRNLILKIKTTSAASMLMWAWGLSLCVCIPSAPHPQHRPPGSLLPGLHAATLDTTWDEPRYPMSLSTSLMPLYSACLCFGTCVACKTMWPSGKSNAWPAHLSTSDLAKKQTKRSWARNLSSGLLQISCLPIHDSTWWISSSHPPYWDYLKAFTGQDTFPAYALGPWDTGGDHIRHINLTSEGIA